MQITRRLLLTSLSWHHTLWFNLCKSRMWENKILSHLHTTSHCLLQLVWLFITTSSQASHCSRPIQESDLYPVDCLEGRKWDVWSGSVVTCTRSPTRMDNPSELGNSPEPCRGGGVQREPEWEAHIVHRGTPPAPAWRHNSQGHGELGQRTSKLPTVRAGWGKKGKVSKVSVWMWLVKCVVKTGTWILLISKHWSCEYFSGTQ